MISGVLGRAMGLEVKNTSGIPETRPFGKQHKDHTHNISLQLNKRLQGKIGSFSLYVFSSLSNPLHPQP